MTMIVKFLARCDLYFKFVCSGSEKCKKLGQKSCHYKKIGTSQVKTCSCPKKKQKIITTRKTIGTLQVPCSCPNKQEIKDQDHDNKIVLTDSPVAPSDFSYLMYIVTLRWSTLFIAFTNPNNNNNNNNCCNCQF